MKKTLLIQKIDLDAAYPEIFEMLNDTTKKSLPDNVQEVTIPHLWNIKKVDDSTLFIQMDESISVERSREILDDVKEQIGEEYTVLFNICEVEVIDMAPKK